MDPLPQAVEAEVYRFFLVFARVAGAISVLPGFGELAVPMRIRLGIALVVALALTPVVQGLPAALPADPAVLVVQLAAEIVVGILLGLGAKLFLSALQVAGGIAGQAIGLSNPFVLEAGGFESGTLFSGVLVLTSLAALFATDLHYLMLDAVARSYRVWPPATPLDTGQIAGRFAELVGATFRLGVGFAAPFILFGVIGNLVLGLVNRVMPAMPVYFVGTPVLLAAGLFLFMATAGAMVSLDLQALANWLHER